jgi:phosphopentomutase
MKGDDFLFTNRVILIVLDSCGIGELPDAEDYGDIGSNTLGNTSIAVGGLHLKNMQMLGIGNIADILGTSPLPEGELIGAYGKMMEKSKGKDTTTGHWEIAGIILDKPFPVYPNGFPDELISRFEAEIGRKIIGNKAASGTEIIKELGPEHIKTGKPIIYTSADSVFQIAAHEEVIPLNNLYEICLTARRILQGEHGVSRVIARPFLGENGDYYRTKNRRDFSLEPIGVTVLDKLLMANIPVYGIGKIGDIYAGRGISEAFHTASNIEGIETTIKLIKEKTKGLIFTNLVDFDMLYGHRNDPRGYAQALIEFDNSLSEIMSQMQEDDLLIITADHGCDPTTESTDHSREYVPLLVYGKNYKPCNLGVRRSFTDVAATLAQIFGVDVPKGQSFLNEILP